jgi:hypothetical protein
MVVNYRHFLFGQFPKTVLNFLFLFIRRLYTITQVRSKFHYSTENNLVFFIQITSYDTRGRIFMIYKYYLQNRKWMREYNRFLIQNFVSFKPKKSPEWIIFHTINSHIIPRGQIIIIIKSNRVSHYYKQSKERLIRKLCIACVHQNTCQSLNLSLIQKNDGVQKFILNKILDSNRKKLYTLR